MPVDEMSTVCIHWVGAGARGRMWWVRTKPIEIPAARSWNRPKSKRLFLRRRSAVQHEGGNGVEGDEEYSSK